MLGVVDILDPEKSRDLKDSREHQAKSKPDPRSQKCEQKSLWSHRRLRNICGILYADRFALLALFDIESYAGIILFLRHLVVCHFRGLSLSRDALEGDLDLRNGIYPCLKRCDLNRVLLSVRVFSQELLLNLPDLGLQPLIFELEALLLQFRLAAAGLRGNSYAFIRIFPEILNLFINACDLVSFRHNRRMLVAPGFHVGI